MIDGSGPLFKTLGGEGPDCILIHGFGSDRLSWAANVPALLPIARIHAVDLPAHGECKSVFVEKSLLANADIFVDGMHKVGISSAHFVGHSLGGAIALAVAARHPEVVKSLALIAPMGLGHGVDGQFLQSLVNVQSVDESLRLLQQLFVRKQLVNKMLAKRLLDHLNKPGIRDALSTLAAVIKGWENEDIANPTLGHTRQYSQTGDLGIKRRHKQGLGGAHPRHRRHSNSGRRRRAPSTH